MYKRIEDKDEHGESIDDFVKNLNPRIYVPEEYESGTYISYGKAQRWYEDYEKGNSKENEAILKLRSYIPVTYRQSIIYGDELASVFEEHDRIIHEKRRMFVDHADVFNDVQEEYEEHFADKEEASSWRIGSVWKKTKCLVQKNSGALVVMGILAGVTGSHKRLHFFLGTQGGVRAGDFIYKWVGDQCTAIKKAVIAGGYVTGRLPEDVSPKNRTNVLVREANYHPDGGQVFFPTEEKPYVVLLALPGDDIKLSDFQAVYFDGSFGVQIHANIWHQPVYPASDEATFLGKQGAVHACMAFDTVNEFGKYLKVPLTKPK